MLRMPRKSRPTRGSKLDSSALPRRYTKTETETARKKKENIEEEQCEGAHAMHLLFSASDIHNYMAVSPEDGAHMYLYFETYKHINKCIIVALHAEVFAVCYENTN